LDGLLIAAGLLAIVAIYYFAAGPEISEDH
jgi:hypothetical protein